MSNNSLAPSTLSTASLLAKGTARDLIKIERAAGKDIAISKARARVIAERQIANNRALTETAIDAMQSAATVSQAGLNLIDACPAAAPMIQSIASATGSALATVVSDTARDLR